MESSMECWEIVGKGLMVLGKKRRKNRKIIWHWKKDAWQRRHARRILVKACSLGRQLDLGPCSIIILPPQCKRSCTSFWLNNFANKLSRYLHLQETSQNRTASLGWWICHYIIFIINLQKLSGKKNTRYCWKKYLDDYNLR